MLSLIKQVFIVLLSFSRTLSTECVPLNDKPCMVTPTLVILNPVELKFYPFMISLDKWSRNCHVLSLKICVPKEKKAINVKAFNMITNKNEANKMAEHIS